MSATKSLGLADDQRFALMKFRRAVADVLQPDHDDHFLLRWLRARKWDAAAAEKMLRESLLWRKRWDVDAIEDWEPPKVLEDYLPHGLSGFDKDGAPVVVVYFSNMDLYGILHVVTRRDMIKMTIKQLEKYLKICKEQTKKHGLLASQVTVIFDMDAFYLKQYLWKPAGETVLSLIQMYEMNYPEILKFCYIVNAPKVFAFAFNVVKRFMNEYTISKIQIFKNDPPKWQAAVSQMVPKDQLPVYLGGTLADPDGNPKYATKICVGGKVPKEWYVSNPEDKQNDDYTTVTVRKGGKFELDMAAPETGSLLSWEFRTDEHDIKFGILRKIANGEQQEVLPMKRVTASDMEETGMFTCDVPATYKVVFDNSYSLLRNKKIHYSIRMIPPSAAVDEMAQELSETSIVEDTRC